MPSFEVEFEVFCACGNGLCRQTSTSEATYGGVPSVTIEPCDQCLAEAKDEGDNEGYERGHSDGYSEGHSDGYDEGLGDGYSRGTAEGVGDA